MATIDSDIMRAVIYCKNGNPVVFEMDTDQIRKWVPTKKHVSDNLGSFLSWISSGEQNVTEDSIKEKKWSKC